LHGPEYPPCGTEVALFHSTHCPTSSIKRKVLAVSTSLYVVQIQDDRILAVEAPEETAAALFDAGHSILLADKQDLIRVARRHDKTLSVLSCEQRRGACSVYEFQIGPELVARRVSKGAAFRRMPAHEIVGAAFLPTVHTTDLAADRSLTNKMELC